MRYLSACVAGCATTFLVLACHARTGGPRKDPRLSSNTSKIQTGPSAHAMDGLRKRFEALATEMGTPGKHLILLAETGDPESRSPGKILPVADAQHWPEDTQTSFVISPSQDGRPEMLQVSPQSESGDWSEMESFLFDEEGHLIFWRHEFSWFGEGDAVNRYQIERAWDASGSLIGTRVQGANPSDRPVAPAPLALTASKLFSLYRLDTSLAKPKPIH